MSDIAQRILVIGATGLVGRAVARGLRRAGYVVRVLARSPQRARDILGDDYDIVTGDIRDERAVAAALEGCFGVHIAVSGGPTPEDCDAVEHRAVADTARSAYELGVERLTYTSGISARPGNEHFPPTRAKLHAAAALAQGKIPYTIFRPSWFFESLRYFVRDGRAAIIGRQPNPLGWLATADYARMVAKSHAREEVIGQTYDVVGPEPMTMLDALTRYCAICHPEIRPKSISFLAARGLAALTGNKELRGAIPLMEFFDKFRENTDVTTVNSLLGAPTITLESWARGLWDGSTEISG